MDHRQQPAAVAPAGRAARLAVAGGGRRRRRRCRWRHGPPPHADAAQAVLLLRGRGGGTAHVDRAGGPSGAARDADGEDASGDGGGRRWVVRRTAAAGGPPATRGAGPAHPSEPLQQAEETGACRVVSGQLQEGSLRLVTAGGPRGHARRRRKAQPREADGGDGGRVHSAEAGRAAEAQGRCRVAQPRTLGLSAAGGGGSIGAACAGSSRVPACDAAAAEDGVPAGARRGHLSFSHAPVAAACRGGEACCHAAAGAASCVAEGAAGAACDGAAEPDEVVCGAVPDRA